MITNQILRIILRYHLVRLELGVVQLLDGVLHVLVTHVLDNTSPVAKDVGKANIAGLTHVIL